MKPKKLALFSRSLAAFVTLIALLTACGSKDPATSTPVDTTTSAFSGFGNVSATLYGLATFQGFDQFVTWPIQLQIPPISVYWMGTIFNGTLQGAGAGNTTFVVHGALSDDGNWIESMSYSQEIIGPSSNTLNFFRVTLNNVPLVSATDSKGSPESVSNRVGSDVQRYVTSIEYQAAASGFYYVSTDLTDTTCVAALDVAFATGPGTQPSSGSSTGGGGM